MIAVKLSNIINVIVSVRGCSQVMSDTIDTVDTVAVNSHAYAS